MDNRENYQTVAAFTENVSATIERASRTGSAQVLTENGETKAVLLSAASYAQLLKECDLQEDLRAIERSMADVESGHVYSPQQASAMIRSRLMQEMSARKNSA